MDPISTLPDGPDYKLIDFKKALDLSDHLHAAHCCLYSRSSTPLFGEYVSSSLISMQLRFDGSLGFPGGTVDKDCSILSSVNRELKEEINLDAKYFAKQEDYLFSHVNIQRKACYHFYAKEVSQEDFFEIEKDALQARDYGTEVLGVIRVPMFTMRDTVRGFPTFLRNCFAGNAKNQLLNFLIHSNLMSLAEVNKALGNSEKGSS